MTSNSENRNKNLKLNVMLSTIYKVMGIGINFLLIPLTINYLDVIQYGIWVTLLSVMSWINFFDIGLGNGLRNKVAEAISINDNKSVKAYISTAYAVIGFIALTFLVGLFIGVPLINWTKVFNTSIIDNHELVKLVLVVSSFFLCNFILSLINQVFYAYQKSAIVGLGQLINNCLAIVLVYILINSTSGSLVYLGISYSIATLLTNILLTVYCFYTYNETVPSIKYIDKTKIKDIGNLGIKFFIVQIAVIIIFSTANIIITQVLGPEHVTAYNIAFRLFGVISMAHAILLTPLWSAYTEAYQKNDIVWIKRTLQKLNLLMVPTILCALGIALFSQKIVKVWIGDNISFPPYLIEFMALYTIISCWNNIYAYFLNGISKVTIQMYLAIIGALINIPISIYFAKELNMGSSGVILGTSISLILFSIIGPVQTYYILKGNKIK